MHAEVAAVVSEADDAHREGTAWSLSLSSLSWHASCTAAGCCGCGWGCGCFAVAS